MLRAGPIAIEGMAADAAVVHGATALRVGFGRPSGCGPRPAGIEAAETESGDGGPDKRKPACGGDAGSTAVRSPSRRFPVRKRSGHDTKADGTGSWPSACRSTAQCIASSPRIDAATLASWRSGRIGTAPR